MFPGLFGSGRSAVCHSRQTSIAGLRRLQTMRGLRAVLLGCAALQLYESRALFLIQIGVPTKPKAARIWFSRKRW